MFQRTMTNEAAIVAQNNINYRTAGATIYLYSLRSETTGFSGVIDTDAELLDDRGNTGIWGNTCISADSTIRFKGYYGF